MSKMSNDSPLKSGKKHEFMLKEIDENEKDFSAI